MRTLGALLVAVGLWVAAMSPFFAQAEDKVRHEAWRRRAAAWDFYRAPANVSPLPLAAVGGGMAAVGLLVLAIRRPKEACSPACVACDGPASPNSRLCARCRR